MIKKKKRVGSITYGGLRIPKIESKDELVPRYAVNIILPESDKKALAIALKENMPALLIGEAGVGKSMSIRQLAFLREQAYVRVNMTGFTTPDELIGSKSVKDGKTYFEYGIITDAMRRGALLVLDEINATSPDCLFILHGLLDEDRRITLPNGQVIYPHKDFRVFATCNPDYEGTKSMNKAFLDRFPIVLIVDVLHSEQEKQLLMDRTKLDGLLAEQFVAIATMARKDYEAQKISSYISTRSLLHIGKLIALGMDSMEAYRTTIVKKTNDKEEQQTLMDFYFAIMRMAQEDKLLEMPIFTTKKKIKDLEDKVKEYRGENVKLKRELIKKERVIQKVGIDANKVDKEIKDQIIQERLKHQFKPGDKVVANHIADEYYTFTKTGWKGVVRELLNQPNGDAGMVLVFDEPTGQTNWVNAQHFDLDVPEAPKDSDQENAAKKANVPF